MASPSVMHTPVNSLSRDNLPLLIRNNTMNESLEFSPVDHSYDAMDTCSPVRKPNRQPISKKLFHSPLSDHSPSEASAILSGVERSKRAKKRKQLLIPDDDEKIKRAYVKECDGDSYSPDICGGMRKRVLISLFHNKEYSMDCS